MNEFTQVRCKRNDRPFFIAGLPYWIKTRNDGCGYHVYVRPDCDAWICNVDANTARKLFAWK